MGSSRHTARQTKSFFIPRERPHAKRGSDLPATKSRLVRIVHTLLTVMPGCTEPKYLNCVRRLEDVLVSRCANPSCEARFKYLHESRLFQFPSVSTPNGVSKNRLNFAFWWLCPRCCSSNDSDSNTKAPILSGPSRVESELGNLTNGQTNPESSARLTRRLIMDLVLIAISKPSIARSPGQFLK